MKNRTIFHVDMDAFFASIEIAKNPSLKNKPVIVGGQPNERGVVSTCSYEARQFGVRSAMPLKEAKRLCPNAIFLNGSYALYREYSDYIMSIFKKLTAKVEIVSIDEAYLDVTEKVDMYGGAVALAQFLKQVIFKRTGLTCSIGIASNKLVAKVSAGTAKPNGLTEVPYGKEAEFFPRCLFIVCLE